MNTLHDRPTLDQYVDFFGDAPEWVADLGWYYGARFVFEQGTDRLSVTVAPDQLFMEVVWQQDGVTRLTLVLTMVVAWTIERNGAREHLLVRVDTGADAMCGFEFCLVRLRPRIGVECRMAWGRGWSPPESIA